MDQKLTRNGLELDQKWIKQDHKWITKTDPNAKNGTKVDHK